MTDVRLRKRHRLRQKEIRAIASEIARVLGTQSFDESAIVDMAETLGFEIVIVDGKALAFVVDGHPFLTVRGLLRYSPTKRYVTVDMGAVKFVANGADVMGPGIVDCDREIAEGELVWIRDVTYLKPLAVGRAIVAAPRMAMKEKGKAVASIHYVGDKLWALDEPKPET
jgi:PUA domain protein